MNRHLNRALTYFLAVIVIAAIGSIIYIRNHPPEERLTECGLLGPEGKAAGYPVEITLKDGKVVKVGYEVSDQFVQTVQEDYGQVIVQVVNRGTHESTYRLEVWIDGKKETLWLDSQEMNDTGLFTLKLDEKWEHLIGFAPKSTGEKVEVQFVLYQDGQLYFKEPPRLWINVKSLS